MSEIRIRQLRKTFGAQCVLHDVDLTIEAGSLVALLGPSGSGKTTLLRLLCGFERADAGTIEIGGARVAGAGLHLPAERRRIGYVPQEGGLFPHLSVADNIVFGLPRAQRRTHHRVAELLAMVGLPAGYAARAPQQLSGGQQQRVALARALAPAPSVVLLDEPFSSLDAALRAETRDAVRQALAAAGATAMLVTHDQAEALSLGDRVAVLWQGRMVQVAAPRELYRRPATRELAAFVGDAVLLPASVVDGLAHCALGALPVLGPAASGAARAMLRPEQLRLLDGDDHGAGFEAVVTGVSFNGRDAAVRLLTRTAEPLALAASVPGHRSPELGSTVRARVDGAVVVYPLD
ncbi:ABC transporter ATP-binding protein [Burkholderia plantarii]|uniref:ABC transporter ATP-binding protein n=1 Tax=Burkholderia plantarii TaxID=41899 RepID=UPI0006D8AE3E|nr:ABC transporter ATP-binding protein [Burkholderia plantarii]ALK33026.1 ABC-type spermidine/putrescine transport system, ATPase component [Burkholderia plantarii]MBI0330251.1 ABC transporter ATP-binding protein [Burkholderia plantarii]GLZ20457.1 ABC transporter [Burkholderia plantarii]